LTLTPTSVAEAIDRGADVVVAHHPLPFRPLKRLTTDSTPGRLLLELIAGGVAVISPHTAFDSARSGINSRLAEGLGLSDIAPIALASDQGPDGTVGTGRWGRMAEPITLRDVANRVKRFLSAQRLQVVGPDPMPVSRVAVACGSGGELLEPARQLGCHCLVTGEARFHTCLEAEAAGMGLVLPGHFASERFAVQCLGDDLTERLAGIEVWVSQREQDPLRWI
jgi:dinuclear metal center YbgI/SA1388 family protein